MFAGDAPYIMIGPGSCSPLLSAASCRLRPTRSPRLIGMLCPPTALQASCTLPIGLVAQLSLHAASRPFAPPMAPQRCGLRTLPSV